jgi:hypothetical protein
MKARLAIEVPPDFVATHVRVLDPALQAHGEAMLGPARPALALDLEPGPYLVQLERPGVPMEQFVHLVAGGGGTLALKPPPPRSGTRAIPEPAGAPPAVPAPPEATRLDGRYRVELAGGSPPAARWPTPLPGSGCLTMAVAPVDAPDGGTARGPGRRPLLLDADSDRLLLLPGFADATLLDFARADGALVAVGRANNARISSLMAALAAPVAPDAIEVAGVTGLNAVPDGAGLEETAAQLLDNKFLDPDGALVAALFLLRFGETAHMADWVRNCADYFPWAAEGPVVEGWRRLMVPGARSNPALPEWRERRPPPPAPGNPEPNAPRPADARLDAARRFLEAAARPVPTFHFALRRLIDGLLLCFDGWERGALKAMLGDAANRVSAVMGAVDGVAGLTRVPAGFDVLAPMWDGAKAGVNFAVLAQDPVALPVAPGPAPA